MVSNAASPLAIFIMANLFWFASVWWVTCAHPLLWLGLLALSATLSSFWLLFFISAGVAVHRFRIPLFVAMPVCWIGTEYIRCHLLGGFSFCALEHAFYLYPSCVQLASIGGSMLVGGTIMFTGATILILGEFFVDVLSNKSRNGLQRKDGEGMVFRYCTTFLSGLCIVFIIALIMMSNTNPSNDRVGYSIVALQGDKQVHLNSEPNEANDTFWQYLELTGQTIKKLHQTGCPLPDVIIFPETVCPIPVLAFEGSVKPTDVGLTEDEATEWDQWFRKFVQQIDTPVIFGLSTYVFKDNPEIPRRLNSALLVQPLQGDKPGGISRYDKMHLVMFGEYIPFAEYLPDDFFLRTLCPEAHAGNKPIAMPIGQGSEKRETVMASINICFESSVSHLIRNQILALRRAGHDPRVLINLSNCGWFRFSQQIEQHLATHVFRAVENRMWYITATNGGFSAIIDPNGTIVSIGKRGEIEAVSGTIWVSETSPTTIYQKYGDWYALVFAVIVWGLVTFTFVEKRRSRAGE